MSRKKHAKILKKYLPAEIVEGYIFPTSRRVRKKAIKAFQAWRADNKKMQEGISLNISAIPIVNKFYNEKQIVPVDCSMVTHLENFVQWQEKGKPQEGGE